MKTYGAHEFASIFPLYEGQPFLDLVADIKAHGLRDAITLYEGKILDGVNRARACEAAGVAPRFDEWKPLNGESALDFALSRNLHRRHLSESQRAMVADKVRELLRPAAKAKQEEGQKAGGKAGGRGRPKDSTDSSNPNSAASYDTAAEAAKRLNVGRGSVVAAGQVRAHGVPELVAAVERGAVAVSAAAEVASLPKEEQRACVAGGRKAVAEGAKRVRTERTERAKPAPRPEPDPESALEIEYRLLEGVREEIAKARRQWPVGIPKKSLIVALRTAASNVEKSEVTA